MQDINREICFQDASNYVQTELEELGFSKDEKYALEM